MNVSKNWVYSQNDNYTNTWATSLAEYYYIYHPLVMSGSNYSRGGNEEANQISYVMLHTPPL